MTEEQRELINEAAGRLALHLRAHKTNPAIGLRMIEGAFGRKNPALYVVVTAKDAEKIIQMETFEGWPVVWKIRGKITLV